MTGFREDFEARSVVAGWTLVSLVPCFRQKTEV